jgi:hypothetical protein
MMRLTTPRARAYWMSGGDILGRRGPLSFNAAASRFLFYARQAWRCASQGDQPGALYCARRAHDLARALAAAEEWRRAAAGRPRRDFAQQTNFPETKLIKT